jgi:hypothetical protein
MEARTTAHLIGAHFDDQRDAAGFAIDHSGIHAFVGDCKGALTKPDQVGLGWYGECCAGRDGDAWHIRTAQGQNQNRDYLLLDGMSFTSQNRVDDICVFLGGQCIGEGATARLEFDFGPEDEMIVRAGGWAVARYKDGFWRRQDRRGDLHEVGFLTIGPADFHQTLAGPTSTDWRFALQPRSRPSSLASARLALPV